MLVDRAPIARNWVHWTVVDIPAGVSQLSEGVSETSDMPRRARELTNTFGSVGYGGPQPPQGSGQHPYEATIYALDTAALDVRGSTSLDALERAIAGHMPTAGYTGQFGR